MAGLRFIPNAAVIVDDKAVQGYLREGGAVNDLLNDVARGTWVYAKAYTGGKHKRSGRLNGGQFWNRVKLTGPWTGSAIAGSSAKHTRYFHDGTAGGGLGYITHKNMIVPRNVHAAHTNLAFKGAGAEQLAKWKGRSKRQQARGAGVKFKNRVRGQSSKPFLTEGLAVSLAKQRL